MSVLRRVLLATSPGALWLACAFSGCTWSLAHADESCRPQETEVRRRPGEDERRDVEVPCDPTRLPTPDADRLPEPASAADRWRTVEALGYANNPLDPYSGNNFLKGDRPSFGADGFVSLGAVSGSLLEFRRPPSVTPADAPSQVFMSESASFDAVLYRGDTVFRPPDWQVRFSPVFNYSRTQTDGGGSGHPTFSTQALFLEKHLRDVSTHYDFDSVRVGIQPITSDPRGFLLLDQPAGVRLFGTRSSNRYQYSLGWFRPLAKNAARLNDIGTSPPDDNLLAANLYVQDFVAQGFTLGLALIHDRNRVSDKLANITYVGVNGDGHVGRMNFTGAAYYAYGKAPSAALSDDTRARSYFAASELSVDFDWVRTRLSALYASGDSNLHDGKAAGFAGLNSTPIFAGADSSFFLHQRLPLTASFDLKQRDRLFTDLRGTDGSADASFVGPGLGLLGVGLDFDLSQTLRLSLDANHVGFDETAALSALMARTELPRDVGWDLSVNLFYRPFATQNVIVRFAGAMLEPSDGYRALYGTARPYSLFMNLILAY